MAEALGSQPTRLFDAPIFYPNRNTFAYSDSLLLPGALTVPARWLGADPIATYNAFLLASMVGSGLAAALLCQRLTGSWLAAAVGGLVFTANPHRLEHVERLELVSSFAVPLAFLCWHRGIGSGKYLWCGLASLCVALQWYSGMYHGLFLATLLPVLIVDWAHEDAETRRRSMKAALIGVAAAAALVAPSIVPYSAARGVVGERSVGEAAAYSGRPSDFLATHPRNVLYGDTLGRRGAPERHFFPGVVAGGLALIGLFSAQRRTLLLYAAVLLLALDLTLGTNGAVYPVLRDVLAPYHGIRAPARAATLVFLPVAVFSSVGLARIVRPLGAVAGTAVAAAALAACLVEYRMQPDFWTISAPTTGEALPETVGVTVEYPLPRLDRLDLNFDAHYLVSIIGSWTPMLNGYSGYYPRSYETLLARAVGFPDDDSVAAMSDAGATHIVVHSAWLEGRFEEIVGALLARPDVELTKSYREHNGEVAVFKIVRQANRQEGIAGAR